MRNILAHVPAKSKLEFAKKLKQIWLQPDLESARGLCKTQLWTHMSINTPTAIEVLEQGLEDSLQFYAFKRIRSPEDFIHQYPGAAQ
jgi:putative transposase